MSDKFYEVNIAGRTAELPLINIAPGVTIAFFNLHGNVDLTEHCGKELAKRIEDCDIVLTAESKGLQLSHVVARELGHKYYAVARKSYKPYLEGGKSASTRAITSDYQQTVYISKHDADLIKGKKVAIVDDVVSTGGSLTGLEELVEKAGGIVRKRAFVLAEGDAAKRNDIEYLAAIPLF